MISEEALGSFRCLETGSQLSEVGESLLEEINRSIRLGEVVDQSGQKITREFDGALINRERTVVYAIVDSIPRLLLKTSIPLKQLNGNHE